MKRLVTIIAACAALSLSAQVKPGIEVLRDRGFDVLQGKRAGLITNPSGVDNSLRSSVDILAEAPGVKLTGLYAPEHGVRGDVHAGDKVDNMVDPATGVPVYSVYGKTHKPTAEMLKDVDALVYDIQDNGCRSFTFISTMGKAMEACAELDKEFIVLDRPNPVGGNKIEGNIVEDSCFSFVSQFAIPYLYGLTPGELATYLNEEGLLPGGKKVRLTVVPMEGYSRDMDFRSTGMPWVLPSPHIPNPETALYYPMSGILGELYCMSIGVGYTLPFKLFCASWIDAGDLAKALNDKNIPGMKFRPIHIKPFYSTGKGEKPAGCRGLCDRQRRSTTHLGAVLRYGDSCRAVPRPQAIRHSRQIAPQYVRQSLRKQGNPPPFHTPLQSGRYGKLLEQRRRNIPRDF